MAETTKRAAIYARVSTEEQSTNYSLPTQLDACRKYAQQRGYTIVNEFVDAYTGTTLKRPDFDRLKASVGKLDAVIVYVQDRLGRSDELDTWNLIRFFQEKGCIVHTTDSGPIDGNDFLKMLGPLVKARAAKEEAEKIGERTSRGKRARAKAGKVVAPTEAKYGYDYDAETGKLAINTREVETVRNIYKWYTEGDGTGEPLGGYAIASKLTKMGIPTRHDTNGLRKRKRVYGVWCRSSVMRILRDETYAGVWYYNRSKRTSKTTRITKPRSEWIAVPVPAIVSRELWETAQEQGKKNEQNSPRNTKNQYLMRGRMTCAVCGYTFHCRSDYRTHTQTPFYTCHGQMAGFSSEGKEPTCHNSFEQSLIDDLIWDAIAQVLKQPQLIVEALRQREAEREAQIQPDRDYIGRCQAELAKLNARRERLLLLYLDGTHDKTWLDDQLSVIDRSLYDFQSKIDELTRHIAEMQTATVDADVVQRTCEVIQGIDLFAFDQKRMVIEAFNVRAIVHRGDDYLSKPAQRDPKTGRFTRGGHRGIPTLISITGYLPIPDITPDTFEAIPS